MEIFVDFGVFELVAAISLLAVARQVYSHRVFGALFLVASVASPAASTFISTNGEMRWLTAASLGTALVNAAVILAVLQRGDLPALTVPRRPKTKP